MNYLHYRYPITLEILSLHNEIESYSINNDTKLKTMYMNLKLIIKDMQIIANNCTIVLTDPSLRIEQQPAINNITNFFI